MNKGVLIDFIKKYPLATVCVLVLIGSVAAIFLRGDLSSELESEEVALNSRLKVLNANTKNSVGLEANVNTLQAQVDSFKSRLIDPEQRAVNINFFYSLEQLAPIRISGVNVAGGNDPNFARSGPNTLTQNNHSLYDLVIQGTLQDILIFLNKISNVDPFLRVTKCTLTSASMAEKTFSARLRLVVLSK